MRPARPFLALPFVRLLLPLAFFLPFRFRRVDDDDGDDGEDDDPDDPPRYTEASTKRKDKHGSVIQLEHTGDHSTNDVRRLKTLQPPTLQK